MKYKIEQPEELPATPELNALAQWLEKIKTPPVNVVQMPTLSPVAVKLCDWPLI